MLQKQKLFYLNLKINNWTLLLSSNYVKNYLYITTHVRNTHTNNIIPKLVRGDSNLVKLRYYVNKEIFRTIYFAIFYSYLTHVTTVCGQTRIP